MARRSVGVQTSAPAKKGRGGNELSACVSTGKALKAVKSTSKRNAHSPSKSKGKGSGGRAGAEAGEEEQVGLTDRARLSDRAREFARLYSSPDSPCYLRAGPAAIGAGYSERSAYSQGSRLRRDPAVAREIAQAFDLYGGEDLREACKRWVSEKITRGDYNAADFYEVVECYDKQGEPYRRVLMKPFEQLTEKQKLCVDGIDLKGTHGDPVYVLPNRERVREWLIDRMDRQEAERQGGEGFDVETLSEVVNGELKVKTRLIKRNAHIASVAEGFMEGDGGSEP